jgi:glyceraldehyde 3-phosphate dehydrogenase
MKIAINGFGRIGRVFFRQAFGHGDFDIVALNDLGDIESLAYLLRHDSVYREYDKEVGINKEASKLVVGGKEIQFLQEKDPQKLPWGDLGVDVVVESTGVFTSADKAKAHLDAGAKRVVISAPAKDEITPTATPNVGMSDLGGSQITSNASCTTNATTPVVAILMHDPGIQKALLTTLHGYTASQALVDSPHRKDLREGRAAAQNIVPASTGAAKAVGDSIPDFKGLFDGIAMRIPIIAGSIIDFTMLTKRKTSVEEVNEILTKAAQKPEWEGIFMTTNEPLVSSDILGKPYGSIADLALTRVVDGDLVKVCAWYDNEWGYCAMLVKHIEGLKGLL